MCILRVRENRIESPKCCDIILRLHIENRPHQRTNKSWKFLHIPLTKIKKISWRRMAIIVHFRIWTNMPESIETIPRKNHDIILSKHLCPIAESMRQCEMTNPLRENGFPENNHLPFESEFPRIKAPLRKKSRNQIRIKCLRHERHESLPSSTIEE
jgi:hypothetical protein